ncbi:hypothetical protein HacjB3_18838 (plasmid) [Halalkalicoccus jeotgali B3]|uniref:Uncharacterized protein n=1 Tax=Halalkalicoccus jeotgali (strain DSM 18796 / CECT 7217 / JCM 14584 / KCTC 4019 / B3) TaxID=795797 RepID=D8JCK0_HALJB|nr:hypothetical protein HacjB3_18838 [Halalkalicoccus jeotgali B3]
MVSKTSFKRASDTIVLCSVASKHLDRAIIPFDWNRYFMDFPWMLEPLDDIRTDIQTIRSMIQLPASRFK